MAQGVLEKCSTYEPIQKSDQVMEDIMVGFYTMDSPEKISIFLHEVGGILYSSGYHTSYSMMPSKKNKQHTKVVKFNLLKMLPEDRKALQTPLEE